MDKVIYGNKMYTGLSIMDGVCYCPASDFCPHISERHLELQGRDGPLRATGTEDVRSPRSGSWTRPHGTCSGWTELRPSTVVGDGRTAWRFERD